MRGTGGKDQMKLASGNLNYINHIYHGQFRFLTINTPGFN